MPRLFLPIAAVLALLAFPASSLPAAEVQPPKIDLPGEPFAPPEMPTAAGAPQIFEHTPEAGPDDTFFLTGSGLTNELTAWGVSPDRPEGGPVNPHVQLATEHWLAATLPEKAYDGVFLVWARNKAGYSRPIVLNAPQPWWCGPDRAKPGAAVTVFGRNLARGPDKQTAFVCLTNGPEECAWAEVLRSEEHDVRFLLPSKLAPGKYDVWVHAGHGGRWGWGGPVKLTVVPHQAEPKPIHFTPRGEGSLQDAVDKLGRNGGGTLLLPLGTIPIRGTLRIPADVNLLGTSDGMRKTILQFELAPKDAYPPLGGSGWDKVVHGVHTAGDTIEYRLDVPQTGPWNVWIRYGTEMSPWKMPGMSGRTTLQADDQPPAPLENLPNTGSFGTFRWSKSATLELTAGRHKLVWKNVKGGGLSTDAYLLALDPAYTPTDGPPPETGPGRIVLQAEDFVKMVSKEGRAPGADRAAVWLAGDRASAQDLTILGNSQINLGILIAAHEPTQWLDGCRAHHVHVADCEGKDGENCAIQVRRLAHGDISDNDLWGRAPLFILGMRQTSVVSNRLGSVTRFGGNAEAAILGRCEPLEECIVTDNTVGPLLGAAAGGPTARRLIWFSTGHGSVTHNWISENGPAVPLRPTGFGGVAGSDQNVGETILFEGNHRTAYFGPPAAADAQSVTLPKTIPPTPDDRLGSVKREQLAHDAAGNETPFWPPDADDGSAEPPLGEYYITVVSGTGLGQTRRAVSRQGERILLDRPWRVPPDKGSLITMGVAFYQNLIVGNDTPDGMTGVQLWISCMENVISGNTIARQRKPGIFLYASGTTLASSMPRSWNRGLGPLYWNTVEGNRAEDSSDGILVTSGDAPNLPIEFPRALGNVVRHNSLIHSRGDGVAVTSRKGPGKTPDPAASIVGTIVDFNVVRDATVAYHAGNNCDVLVLRRNHAYAWYPVDSTADPMVGLQINDPRTTAALEANTVEGKTGVPGPNIIEWKNPPDKK